MYRKILVPVRFSWRGRIAYHASDKGVTIPLIPQHEFALAQPPHSVEGADAGVQSKKAQPLDGPPTAEFAFLLNTLRLLGLKLSSSLLWEADTAEQVGVAWIGADIIQFWLDS